MAEPSESRNPSKSGEKTASSEVLPRAFGRLTLLRQLARGGMGEVYLAAAGGIEGAERPCVVKIIRREHADDKSFLARFLDEARIQAQLQHPAVATILEASTDDDGKPYVVVEHIEGRNLGEVRTRASQLGVRLSWAEVVSIGICLTEGLAHVHERTDAMGRPLEIVHRDLSPQNVMVGYAGDVKLIDFGTARAENRRCHTVSGIVFAKPGYVAPEVANHTPGGVPADVYAVGIMLWELLAGRRFLSGDSAEHLAAVAAGQRAPEPIAERVDAPVELDAVIARLTATRIQDRYGSARDAATDLIALLKRGPSLTDGERSVRGRVGQLMQRLYPSEPARTRAEFSRLLVLARKRSKQRRVLPPASPLPAATDASESLPGTRYRLLRELGRGAMGVVHEAVHVDLGRSFAVKVLSASTLAGADSLRAEARAIARLRHENIVALHDFGVTSDGRPFYAMERLDGESLDAVLARDGALPWRDVMRIGIDACTALAAAHAAGVLHRDIKPANLFATRAGAIKLLDFGVAKSIRELEPAADAEALHILGTPEYLPPEHFRRTPASEQSDLYSLGVVLYELLTGGHPHPAPNLVSLIEAKTKTCVQPPSLRAKQRGLSKMVDKTILRALDTDPDKRFESAEEMKRALTAALAEPEMRRARRRRIGFVAVGAVTAALGVAVAFGAAKPEVRERAAALLGPAVQKFRGAAPEADAPVLAAAQDEASPTPQEEAEQEPAEEAEVAAAEPAEGADSSESLDDDEASEPVAAAAPAAEAAPAQDNADLFAASPVAQVTPGDDLEMRITKAQEMMQNGQKVKGFNELRRLGKNHRKDVRVLRAWCEAATQMKGWGEAHRVARQWAAIEKSPESRVALARLERAVGKREQAIKTLTALLAERPGHEEARHMLSSMQAGNQKLAQR